MNKKKKQSDKIPILDGYKKVGKRFIPPMKQIQNMSSISYVDDILPELIWIGLLNERFGYMKGIRIIKKIFLAVNEIKKSDQHGNFALMSNFDQLTSKQKMNLIKTLEQENVVQAIRNSIAPLVLLYDNCPLRFFGPPISIIKNDELIMLIKQCVEKTIDKYETPSIVLCGTMLISGLVTNTIKCPADMNLPDFNSVIVAPDSDEAKRAAGFMRATAMANFEASKVNNTWAQHFWNRGFEISPCEINEDEQENG